MVPPQRDHDRGGSSGPHLEVGDGLHGLDEDWALPGDGAQRVEDGVPDLRLEFLVLKEPPDAAVHDDLRGGRDLHR